MLAFISVLMSTWFLWRQLQIAPAAQQQRMVRRIWQGYPPVQTKQQRARGHNRHDINSRTEMRRSVGGSSIGEEILLRYRQQTDGGTDRTPDLHTTPACGIRLDRSTRSTSHRKEFGRRKNVLGRVDCQEAGNEK